ncbi:LacI family DNA-binding transcriptional regulator [Zhihengliuella flava]|uniref:LacI family transcriptional regulator n=1 Tax=Zhihengliuella flava TaxID=1285193 RepID=A0A931DCG5_9MICC|nr:LacI family DNA-binding transcriptional regulator [Zhihengliuella flava]MBG6084991.1 LacI family transcriptional regulator [Zhihengliuella flava]
MADVNQTSSSAKAHVTRKDVARLAGVSTAVVSYVVNQGPKRVAPATEEKVRQAIEALGYQPNAAARALKLGSSEMFGMVVPDATNAFFAGMVRAVENAALERGFAVLFADSDGSLATERRLVQNLVNRRVDGVFLSSVLLEPDLTDLERADIPVVLLNRSVESPLFSSVGVTFAKGARMAVEHLIGHGHQEVGLVMGTNSGEELDGREVGWQEAVRAAGLSERSVIRSEFTREGGFAAGQRFVALRERPSAVFVSSDLQAIGFLRAVLAAGLRVPEDVAIFGFDGSPESAYSWPPLSTVVQPVEAMARAAVDALFAAREGGDVEHRVFEVELLPRASCGC